MTLPAVMPESVMALQPTSLLGIPDGLLSVTSELTDSAAVTFPADMPESVTALQPASLLEISNWLPSVTSEKWRWRDVRDSRGRQSNRGRRPKAAVPVAD